MKPSLFRDLSFDAAKAAAAAEGKWLLVDFTAEWCEPCKHMDATTWRDAGVEAWMVANAVAVQIDVDANKELAARLNAKHCPMVAILDGEAELDRSAGAKSASDLLSWVNGLKQGRTSIDVLRDLAASDLHARMRLSEALQARGLYEEAAKEALWLWDRCLRSTPPSTAYDTRS